MGTIGGLYSAYRSMCPRQLPCKVKGLGIPDRFVGQGTCNFRSADTTLMEY